MASEDQQRQRRAVSIALPPAWLVFNLLLVAAVAALVWADREYWHWYAPPPEIVERVVALESRAPSDRSRMSDVERDLRDLRSDLQENESVVDAPILALTRISSAVAILSLVQAHGGFQSSGSPQGQACIQYLLQGEGSVTDCGFVRTE